MKIINAENLTKFYGAARGIVDVSFSVEEGDFYGFIGPNGAGKSTTIRTALGLIAKTSGKIEIFGKDAWSSRREIAERVGYLSSDVRYYHPMSAGQIIEFSASMRKRDCKAEAKLLCERLELDPTRKVSELSLGNRKKVGIICALQHKPSLYILDEPTSGLDPLMQREFYNILKERNDEGATVFLSSHVLSEVGKYCKSAGVIKEGRLILSDRVDALTVTGVKRVTLRGVPQSFKAPGEARDVLREGDSLSFLYSGEAKELVTHLAGESFGDLSITDPPLEDVFMHYYEREEK